MFRSRHEYNLVPLSRVITNNWHTFEFATTGIRKTMCSSIECNHQLRVSQFVCKCRVCKCRTSVVGCVNLGHRVAAGEVNALQDIDRLTGIASSAQSLRWADASWYWTTNKPAQSTVESMWWIAHFVWNREECFFDVIGVLIDNGLFLFVLCC